MQFQQPPPFSARRRRKARKAGAAWYLKLRAAFVSDRARFIAFVGFVLLAALTGGSARPDPLSLLILRPAAVLLCGYALLVGTGNQFREVRIPLLIGASLMLLALLQLVPLPAAIWTSLPHRATVAQASALVGIGGVARPISLDPARTWNTFFALFVPLAAIALVAIQAPDRRQLVVPMLAAIALLAAFLGFLQAIGGSDLQFYRVTNDGYATGLFANRNHQGTMLLWLMLAASWLATTANPRRLSATAAIGAALATILAVFPLLVLTGSRAGLLLSVPTLTLCGWLLFRAPATRKVLQRAGSRAKLVAGATIAIMIAPLLFVFGVLAVSNRTTALSRLFTADVAEGLRWQYLPLFKQMALNYLPFGSGFGSFERTFNAYEPADMLTSRYMNQAHNDPMQLVIEGGLPALAILLVALTWVGLRLWRIWRSPQAGSRSLAVFLGGSIALWLAASLVDYPLRTPLAAMLIASLTAWVSILSTAPRSAPTVPGGQAGAR